jgi:antirestriction protein ArdC
VPKRGRPFRRRRGAPRPSDLGITPETRDDHAAYIASWPKVLKDDKRAIFTVASHAQKAADYLHGLQPREAQS